MAKGVSYGWFCEVPRYVYFIPGYRGFMFTMFTTGDWVLGVQDMFVFECALEVGSDIYYESGHNGSCQIRKYWMHT